MAQIGVMRNAGFEKGKVVGKWAVRLPAGSVADAASNPAHSSPRLGALLWEFTPPHRPRIALQNAKVNAIFFLLGEVAGKGCSASESHH